MADSGAKRVGAAATADLVLLTDGGWSTLVFANDAELARGVEALREELEWGLEDEGSAGKASVADAGNSVDDLVAELRKHARADVVVVTGLDRVEVARLELLRNALVHGPRIVFALTVEAAARLSAESPNAWAWIGGRCLSFDSTEGMMDSEARLASLRSAHQLDDAEVIRRAEEHTLPLTPAFVEWLILLKKGDLLGRS